MTVTNKRQAEEVRAELRSLRLDKAAGAFSEESIESVEKRIAELADALHRYNERKQAAKVRRQILFDINGHHGRA